MAPTFHRPIWNAYPHIAIAYMASFIVSLVHVIYAKFEHHVNVKSNSQLYNYI